MKTKHKKLTMILGVVIALCLVYVGLLATRHTTVPFLYRHKAGAFYTIGVYHTDNPLFVDMDSVQTIDWELTHTHPLCKFMADPFIVNSNDTLYIFYEHFPAQMNSTWGDVGVLRSLDGGYSWTFLGIALDEPFHLSFPNVFQYKGDWYMLPSAGDARQLRLYKSTDFPMHWELCKVLRDDYLYCDPMLYIKDSVCYLFASEDHENRFALYTADSLTGTYIEHPCSPIRNVWNNHTRLAGRVFDYEGHPYLFMQEHYEAYGSSTATFRIDTLSPTQYCDIKADTVPIIALSGGGWNANGMHTYNVTTYKGHYVAVMDGSREHKKIWGWDWRNIPIFR